jgi:hypothetical protein
MFPGHFLERELWGTLDRVAFFRSAEIATADTYRQFFEFRNFTFYLITSSGADCKWALLRHTARDRSTGA